MTRSASHTDPLISYRWVIIGCGYTGTRLARILRDAGAEVWASRRRAEDVQALSSTISGVHGHVADLRDPATLSWIPDRAILIDSAPPARDGGTSGESNLARAAETTSARRVVYISSTGVYPPGDGSWIDEDQPVDPSSDRGQARLNAETALLGECAARNISAVSLRAVGIYGPGRGVPARLHAGTYRIIGAGDTYVNRIHVDDLARVVIAAGLVSEIPRSIYNVADDCPETSRVYASAVAEILGVPQPPMVPFSEVAPRIVAMLGANRRVSNERMKSELGVELAYPTWREGLRQVMDEDDIPDAATRCTRKETKP